MKIGYLLRTFPQRSQTFVNNEIHELEELGHSAVLAALYRPGEGIPAPLGPMASRVLYWFDIDRTLLIRILMASFRLFLRFPLPYLKLMARNIGHPIGFLKKVFLAQYFYSQDVGHIHTHFAWEQVDLLHFINKLTGIPYSITLHAADIYSEVYSSEGGLSGAAFLATISQYNKQYMVDQMGIDPKKIQVIHCGVDRSLEAETEIAENTLPQILSVGRLTEKKGFDILIQALGQLNDRGIQFGAKIIGEGPLGAQLQERIGKLGLDKRVELTGSMEHGAVMEEIGACDLFVLPCCQARNRDIDGIPVVLMEAMGAGKPVVSTAISGIPELIQPGAGILVEPENPELLSIAMEKIINDRERAMTMGKKGRQIVLEQFSIQGQAERLAGQILASSVQER